MSNLTKEGLATLGTVSNPASRSAVQSLRDTWYPVALHSPPFVMGHSTVTSRKAHLHIPCIPIIHHSCPDRRRVMAFLTVSRGILITWAVRTLPHLPSIPRTEASWDPGLSPFTFLFLVLHMVQRVVVLKQCLLKCITEEWLFIWRLLSLTVSSTHFNTDNFVPLTHSLIQ